MKNRQLEQARDIVRLLETKYSTNGYVGVEIDHPFDNLERYSENYTIIDCLFENILDEITVLEDNLKYGTDEDLHGLTKLEAKSHLRKLKKFIKEHTKDFYTGQKIYNYLRQI